MMWRSVAQRRANDAPFTAGLARLRFPFAVAGRAGLAWVGSAAAMNAAQVIQVATSDDEQAMSGIEDDFDEVRATSSSTTAGIAKRARTVAVPSRGDREGESSTARANVLLSIWPSIYLLDKLVIPTANREEGMMMMMMIVCMLANIRVMRMAAASRMTTTTMMYGVARGVERTEMLI